MALLNGIQKELPNLLTFFIHIYHAVSQKKRSRSRWLLPAPQPDLYLILTWLSGVTHTLYMEAFYSGNATALHHGQV